jgi:hypothetical protein
LPEKIVDDLVPVDAPTSRAGGSDTKTTLGLTLEPPQGPLVVTQVGLESLVASAVVILHPLLLILVEHTVLDHLGLNGDAGKALETEPAIAVELVLGLNSSHGEGGFDADAPISRRVYG